MLPEDTTGGLNPNSDYVYKKTPGSIYTADFRGNEGKYISVVEDEYEQKEETLYKTSKTQIRAAYIKRKEQIVELKLEKYKVVSTGLELESEIRLDTKNLVTLTNFLKFLTTADISSVSSGKLSFKDNLTLDPDLEQKLKTLASDEVGKKQLLTLFESGYLTSDLDIAELIKKGLSKEKINEKKRALNDFELLIENPDVKEVSDIQDFLKNNPWMFGPEYKTLDFRGAGFSGNPDGRLLRIDNLSDILEVKLPKAELLRIDKMGRQYLSPELSVALGQLTGYLEYYYSEYTHNRDDQDGGEILNDSYGKYYKPKGILLIGRRKAHEDGAANTVSAEPKRIRRLLSYFHWVEVLTYDDLIERARNGLENLTT